LENNLSSDEQIKNYQDILRQYSILNLIAKIVSSTLDLNKILRIILSGVTVGTGSVVGAGSVVTSSIPDGSIAVGSPARVIKTRA